MIREIRELNTRLTFYNFQAHNGPEPGEEEIAILYSCWGAVDKVWLKDLERAKENGTLEDMTLTIRDPRAEYIPDTTHYVGVDDGRFFGNRYGIKTVIPDMQDKRFMTVVVGLVT